MTNAVFQTPNPILGPFSKGTFDSKPWKIIKNKLSTLRSNLQPDNLIPECQQFLQLLQNLTICTNLDEYLGDSSIKKFFFSELILFNIKNILRCNTLVNSPIQQILNQCLKQVVLLWIKTLPKDEMALREPVELILNRYYSRDFIESLRQEKMFEDIWKFIKDQENLTSSVKRMTLACFIIKNFTALLPSDFDKESLSKLRQAIWDRLFHLSENSVDNINEKDAKALVEGYNLLLRRLGVFIKEKQKEIELLKLQISLIWLKSNKRENKYMGLRFAYKVIREIPILTPKETKVIGKTTLSEAVVEIFNEVFKYRFLWRPVRTEALELFLSVILHGFLTSENLKSIKTALRLLAEIPHEELLGFINMLSWDEQVEFIIESLVPGVEDLENLTQGDANILDAIWTVRRSPIVRKKLNMACWYILENNNRISAVVVLRKVVKIYYQIQCQISWVQNVVHFLVQCIQAVKKNIANFDNLRVVELFLWEASNNQESYVLDLIGEVLVKEQVIKLITDHIKYFKAQQKQELNANKSLEEVYLAQISRKIDCFKYLLILHKKQEPLLTYDILNDIWQTVVEEPLIPEERKIMFEALAQIMQKLDYQCITPENVCTFFREKIVTKKTQQQLLTSKEGVQCFLNFFLAANANLKRIWRVKNTSDFVVKVIPEELEGFDEIWCYIMSCQDPTIAEEIIHFLIKIYSSLEDPFESDLRNIRKRHLDRCFKYLRENIDNRSQVSQEMFGQDCLKVLKLISSIMDHSEVNGIGNIKTHSMIVKSEFIEVVTSFSVISPIITIDSNSTLFDLLREVATCLEVSVDEIVLYRYPYKPANIPETQNGRTLSELGIKHSERFQISIRKIPKVDLFRDINTLNLRAEKIFTKFFEQYSDNGKMDPELYVLFHNFCAKGQKTVNSCPVKDVFLLHDSDRDGYLSLEDFLELYLATCHTSPHLVWRDLTAHKQRNDLKDITALDYKKIKENSLVSSIISSNQEDFTLLLSLLDYEEKIALEAWKILIRIPTSPRLFEDIVKLKGVRGIEDPNMKNWDGILNMNSKYKLLYVLNIVEYLIHFTHDNTKILLTENSELLDYLKKWETDFIKHGGLEHLCGIFCLFKPDEYTVLTMPYRRVLSFVKAINSKICSEKANLLEAEHKRANFARLALEYQANFLNLEHNLAAQYMKRSVLKIQNTK